MIGSALDIDPDTTHAARIAEFNADREMLEGTKWRDGPSNVITGGRAEGKTRLAMRWLLDVHEGTQRVLIVPTHRHANQLKREHGLKFNDPRITHLARHVKDGPRKDVEYGIDETVTILTQLLRLNESPHLLTVCTAAPWQA